MGGNQISGILVPSSPLRKKKKKKIEHTDLYRVGELNGEENMWWSIKRTCFLELLLRQERSLRLASQKAQMLVRISTAEGLALGKSFPLSEPQLVSPSVKGGNRLQGSLPQQECMSSVTSFHQRAFTKQLNEQARDLTGRVPKEK